MANQDLITIDISALPQIEQDGDKFLMSANAEDALMALIELKDRIELVETKIKEALKEQMTKLNCVKVEGESVKVIKRFYGDRYEIYDQQVALGLGMAKEVKQIKVDSKAVDEYEKNTGELPEGIKLRERVESVSITEVKEKNEG